MKKISITNIINNRHFGATFDSQEQANEWINSCIAKNSWGKPARSMPKDEVPIELAGLIESEEVIEDILIAHLKAEYEITTEELTQNPIWMAEETKRRRIKLGQISRKLCEDTLDYIAGLNYEAQASDIQIDAFEIEYRNILAALQVKRPGKAKKLIAKANNFIYMDDTVKATLIDMLTYKG